MSLEPQHLERVIFSETGLVFVALTGVDDEKQRWFELRPYNVPRDHAFTIRAMIDWRRIRIDFTPGKFAADLLSDMGRADENGRAVFRAILSDCASRGARIDFRVNGRPYDFMSNEPWRQNWTRLSLHLSKGQLELGTDEGESDASIICQWTARFASAITSILPLEEDIDYSENGIAGFPEGAQTTVKTNKYERDRRNRAAAIAIHGDSCMACDIKLSNLYGEVAEGFIEVHHVIPVSQLGEGYVIDPANDLVPLCPNCHSVAHRRSPPFSVEEIRLMIRSYSL